MGFVKEFKEFISRGNVIDLAVGVIIGGAFTGIVNSLNEDILTPIIGMFGGIDFSNLKLVLGTSETAPTLAYGSFITAVINFLITALVVFCLVKGINTLSKKVIGEAEKIETTKTCPYCKSKIAIDAVKCPHCTTDLEEPDHQSSSSMASSTPSA